jgi:hypothetical protein
VQNLDLPVAMATSTFLWEWSTQSVNYHPSVGDILITLDYQSVAQVELWDDCVSMQELQRVRDTWLITVADLPVKTINGALLLEGCHLQYRCLSTFNLTVEGLWAMDQSGPKLIPLNPAERGLGCVGIQFSSPQNIFVVMHTNNIPLVPPRLQVEWWKCEFASLNVSNTWILGVWDCECSTHHYTQSVFVWLGGPSAPWTLDGDIHQVFMAQTTSNNRIEILGSPSSTTTSTRHPLLASTSTTHPASVLGIGRLTACPTSAPAVVSEVSATQAGELSIGGASTSTVQQIAEILHQNGSISSK